MGCAGSWPAGHRRTRRGRRAGARREGVVEICFANVTSWSKKAEHFFHYTSADVWLAAETHWQAQGSEARCKSLWRSGWRTWVGLPHASLDSDSGSYGGMAAGVKRHLAAQPLQGQARLHDSLNTYEASSYFVGLQIALQGIDVLVVAMYHRGGFNPELMAELLRVTKGGQLPFIALGDFNDPVEVLSSSGWLQALKARTLVPDGPTCSSGSGAQLDYGLVSEVLHPLVLKLEIDWAVPFAPHAALRLYLSRRADALQVWTPRLPRALPSFDPAPDLTAQLFGSRHISWLVSRSGLLSPPPQHLQARRPTPTPSAFMKPAVQVRPRCAGRGPSSSSP